MTSSQPPDQPDRASDSSNGDENSREMAEIILFASRERRKGQEYRLEHYQKLAIQVFGWTLVFWSIFVSQRDLPTSSSLFYVAAITGVLALIPMGRAITPKSWSGGPEPELRARVKDELRRGRSRHAHFNTVVVHAR